MPEHAPPPSYEVIAAFGLSSEVTPLAGGISRSTYRSGNHVLKRVEDVVESEYNSRLLLHLSNLSSLEFTIPRPVSSNLANGSFTVLSWTCAEFVGGTLIPKSLDQWNSLLQASRAFHAALHELVPLKPAFLDERTHVHRWDLAQRVAFGEHPCPELSADPTRILQRLKNLAAHIESLPEDNVDRTSQLVHGDMAGNVLFMDGKPPALIDFSPFWRPVAWAEAIVVSDGLVEYSAPAELVRLVGVDRGRMEMLLKAMTFRVISDWLGGDECNLGMRDKWEAAVDVVQSIISAEVFNHQQAHSVR